MIDVIPRRRRWLALAVTLAAAVASAASLDMAAPVLTYTGSAPPQIDVLTPATPAITRTVKVTAPTLSNGVELTVSAVLTWAGGEIAVPDEGAPVVTATLGPDQGNQLDGGVPPDDAGLTLTSAGSGTITVAAGQQCPDESCDVELTLTLSESLPAQEVIIDWTAVATVTNGGNAPTVTVTVTP
jgi:hypothetical protein